MATTEFIAAIELGSSKITGVAGKRTVTEVCRYWHMPRKTLLRSSVRGHLQLGQNGTKPDFYHQQTGR